MDHVAKSYYFRDLFSRKYFLNHCYRSVYYIINNIVNPVGSKLIYFPYSKHFMFQSHACKNSKRLLSKKKLVVFGLKTSFSKDMPSFD